MITLDADHWQRLLDAERRLTDQLLEFPKAEACGVPCKEMRQSAEEALQRIQRIKANYAPQDM